MQLAETKVTPTLEENLKREFSVVVRAEDIEEKLNERLQAMGRKAKIDGFRPGKVPLDVLKKNYGPSVMGEVLEQVVGLATNYALQEAKIRPAMQPKIEIVKFEEGKDLEYKIALEVYPEIPEVDVKKIKLTRYVTEVDEAEIKKTLERLAEQLKDFAPVKKKRAAKEGDAVKIDFVGKVKGEAFEGGTMNDHTLELGAGQFIEGFEEQLVGSKPGDEVAVKVTFPKEYHSKELAGKKAVFDVTVHEVLEATPQKIDDSMAEKVGAESLDAIKNDIRARLENEYGTASRNLMKRDLFDHLEKSFSFEVPEGMVQLEFDGIWQQIEHAKKENPDAFDKSEKELEKEYRAMSDRRVRLGMLLAEIGEKQGIEVSPNDLTQEALKHAQQYPGQEQFILEHYQKNPDKLEGLRGPALEEKVVDFIFENATVKDEKLDAEALGKKLEELE